MSQWSIPRSLVPEWVKKLRRLLRAKYTEILIARRWKQDCAALPLTEAHKPLYYTIQRLCRRELGRFANLQKCEDYNDRIQWLKLFDQSEEHIRCADKLAVRDYIRKRGGAKYLTEVFQIHDEFDRIRFEDLPSSFVIKTNNESGMGHVLVKDKVLLDIDAARKRITRALQTIHGRDKGEWHYAWIKPKVFVEEYIESGHDSPPSDYRFHCVDGKIAWVQNDIPFLPKMKEVTVDPGGNPMGVHFSTHKIYSEKFARPVQWEEMSELARVLSSGWKYVRIDMFVNGQRIYAGEITFFPYCGCYKGEGQKKLGPLLNFDRTTFRPPIYHSPPKNNMNQPKD